MAYTFPYLLTFEAESPCQVSVHAPGLFQHLLDKIIIKNLSQCFFQNNKILKLNIIYVNLLTSKLLPLSDLALYLARTIGWQTGRKTSYLFMLGQNLDKYIFCLFLAVLYDHVNVTSLYMSMACAKILPYHFRTKYLYAKYTKKILKKKQG